MTALRDYLAHRRAVNAELARVDGITASSRLDRMDWNRSRVA